MSCAKGFVSFHLNQLLILAVYGVTIGRRVHYLTYYYLHISGGVFTSERNWEENIEEQEWKMRKIIESRYAMPKVSMWP